MMCRFPKLTPLQARFAASLLTLAIVALTYWSVSKQYFAYAAELEHDGTGASRDGQDHNWHRIQQEALLDDGVEDEMLDLDETVEDDDNDRQTAIVARADPVDIDANDSPNNANLISGQTNVWLYSQQLLTGPHAERGPGLPSNVSEDKRSFGIEHSELRKRALDEEEAAAGEIKRQTASVAMYVSINTCTQPSWDGPGVQMEAPPQLVLYVGTSGNRSPGEGSTGPQQRLALTEGFAAHTVEASSDVYLAVSAPELPTGFTGGWNYDLAVSIDGYYHSANITSPFLYLIDTDTNSALLVTDNLTQAAPDDPVYQRWIEFTTPLPFILFANNANNTRALGLSRSLCGLQNTAQIHAVQKDPDGNSSSVDMKMTTRGLGNKPKQQFLVEALNGSSSYIGALGMPGNGTVAGKGVVGGGGTVWQPTNWTTKSDGNCQLLYGLQFCDEVAYAVPSNPQNYSSRDALARVYDDYASSLYTNFSYSLQQIACNTSSDSQYSLARTCQDCAHAYKQWLCAVTLPRCEDFSKNATYLQPRNVGQPFFQNQSMLPADVLNQAYRPMPGAPTLPGSPIDQTWISAFATNQSRNPAVIDAQVAPGPYKEVLPCEDLCYSLVQSCPAALGFGCPFPGRGLEAGYGQRPDSNSVVQCSYLGAVYYMDGAGSLAPGVGKALGLALVIGFVMVAY